MYGMVHCVYKNPFFFQNNMMLVYVIGNVRGTDI